MALRIGCKIVCSHFENEFCAMTFPKNYHRLALRAAYNCRYSSHMEDVEMNPYSKKFTDTYKLRKKGDIASQFVEHSKIPMNNFTVNRGFKKIFAFGSAEPEMTNFLKIRKMSTLQPLPGAESDDEADPPIEQENEFARILYNRFRMPQLRDQRTLNHIAFSRKHIIETPKLPKYFQTKIATGNTSTFKKPATTTTSPRGLRHQFNFSKDRLPETPFFSNSDLLDPGELKRIEHQTQNEAISRTAKQKSYNLTEAYSNRTYKTSSFRNQQRAQPNIFSTTGYTSGDIWRKRKYAPRFVVDSESLKLNLLDQTKQMKPNLYHDMTTVSKSPSGVTNRLSLLLNQNILQSNTRKASSKTYVNGFLENVTSKPYVKKKNIPANTPQELVYSTPIDISTPGQIRKAGFIPEWPGRKGKIETKTWCFKPKKQRKELSFLKQFLMSCYKRGA